MNEFFATLEKLLNTKFLKLGEAELTVSSIVYVLFLFLALIFLAGRLKKFVIRRIEISRPESLGSLRSIVRIVHHVVVAIGAAIILQSTGLNLSAFTVIAGAVGIGLGFGLQTIISNFFSGLIILFERPIKVGDRIEVASITGEVRDISIRATTIVTNDNIAVIVPNSEFISSTVVNWSFTDKIVRFKFEVGVSYASDPYLVKKLLLAVADNHSGVLKTPAPSVIFDAFGDSSLNFTLYAWTEDYYNRPRALKSEINFAIWDSFKESKIEIPFPQRDVHIYNKPEALV